VIRPGPAFGLILAGILLAAGLVWMISRHRATPPEAVFLLVVDTLRSDRLSCYGCRTNETPHIDRLAEAGVRFERAHSVGSWTVPSMGAVMTSRYPTQLGLVEKAADPERKLTRRDKRIQLDQTIPFRAETLAEAMRDHGYRTAAFVNQPALFIGSGFRQGFEDWFYPVSAEEIKRYEPDERPPGGIPFMNAAHRLDTELVEALVEWVKAHREEKLFVWLHLLTPHSPYSPPSRYMSSPASPQSRAARYDGEIRSVDDMIGEIVSAIEKEVGLERSSIVLTSDHGEAFGEHGVNEHGNTLHREVVQVPLILVAPSLPAGRTVQEHVRTIDILPTILDLARVEPAEPSALEGVSLLPLIRGKGTELPVFSEGLLYGSTERSLITGGYKLMYDEQGENYSLYDLSWDANETIDLAERQPERAREMGAALTALHSRLLEEYVGPETSPDEGQALEAMRALGYVDD
jgi:arylsulfatase A-like enzyme